MQWWRTSSSGWAVAACSFGHWCEKAWSKKTHQAWRAGAVAHLYRRRRDGFGLYGIQGAPTTTGPMVLSNAFAQVLVVSAAEVVVCWTAIGSTVEAALLPYGRARAILGAVAVSSILFGVYHFAHSPPVNNPMMVALLTIVWLVTSIVFFVSRSVYAATVFHIFLVRT